MYERLARWARRASQRTTISDDAIVAGRGKSLRKGVLLGIVDGKELNEEMLVHYRGRAKQKYVRPSEP
jgi:hypothetical protein